MAWQRTLQRSTFWAGLSLILAGIGEVLASGDWARGAQSIVTGVGLITAGKTAKDAHAKANAGQKVKVQT